jgi:energy-coupling factor transport system permease protein
MAKTMTATWIAPDTCVVGVHLGRWTHAGAWWLWSLLLAVSASRTTNPLFLLLLICVLALVVHRRERPGGRTFSFFLKIAALIVVIRAIAQMLLGGAWGDTVIATLPSITLPDWAVGLRLGGPVVLEVILAGFYDGLRLATIILCIGAANALASPRRLLKSLPSALYEFGVSIVIALTFAPQLIRDIDRVRSARRLRGRATRGPRAFAGAALPVLHSALDQSIELAAAMDARGYGRVGSSRGRERHLVVSLIAIALVTGALGIFGLMAAQIPAALAWSLALGALSAACVALALASRHRHRTVYRPDPWGRSEWIVIASGVLTLVLVVVTALLNPGGMTPPTDPPTWPSLPIGALLALIAALSAGFLSTPRPEDLP